MYDFSWSPAGEIFVAQEKDGMKTTWNWYLIEEQEPYLAAEGPKPTLGKVGKQLELKKTNKMAAEVVTYEFKKTCRIDAIDQYTRGVWDKFGRFFVIHGIKGPTFFDKEQRHIRFFSIFGETL